MTEPTVQIRSLIVRRNEVTGRRQLFVRAWGEIRPILNVGHVIDAEGPFSGLLRAVANLWREVAESKYEKQYRKALSKLEWDKLAGKPMPSAFSRQDDFLLRRETYK